MKLRFTIAGLCVFALAALPLRAQHGGGGHSGGGHSGGGAPHGGGGGWHASSGDSGGGHYSGGSSEPRGNAGGSYGGVAMYPPSAQGRGSAGFGDSERPAESYASHEPSSQSGWQSLYAGGSNIHFSASMLPPNSRGYSAAPRESSTSTVPTRAGTPALRLQSQWIARVGLEDQDRFHHRFYGGYRRGFGGLYCGPFLGFGVCGGTYFYGFYSAGFGCIGGSYWDASNWQGASAVLNLSPCIALAYEPDEDQVSPDDSQYESGYLPAQADANATADDSSPPVVEEDASSAPAAADHRPVTLLQLKDGTMYGLTQYWVAGGLLNYITDYGARNAIPFDRIDIAKTVQLNSQRGVPFILETNSPAR